MGDLKVARQAHDVIQVDNEFIVVGGVDGVYIPGKKFKLGTYEAVLTESCKLNGPSMTCTTRKPSLKQFTWFPKLILNQ